MASCKECIHHDLCFDNGTLFIHFTAIGREKENVETNCPFKKFKSIVDVVEVKHGKWSRLEGEFVCSNCYNIASASSAYCPLCGTKMDVPPNVGEKEGAE